MVLTDPPTYSSSSGMSCPSQYTVFCWVVQTWVWRKRLSESNRWQEVWSLVSRTRLCQNLLRDLRQATFLVIIIHLLNKVCCIRLWVIQMWAWIQTLTLVVWSCTNYLATQVWFSHLWNRIIVLTPGITGLIKRWCIQSPQYILKDNKGSSFPRLIDWLIN